MKYYVIAGERSGDLHASELMKELKTFDSKAEFRFWGGDMMQAQGGTLVKHYKELSYMGFWEVFTHLFTIMGFIKKCKADIASYQPDALILVDYAGFNLRMAKFAKQIGIPVHYYISPKVWAWKQKRAIKIKNTVDHLYSILPLEVEFFKKFQYDIHYVGNPTMNLIDEFESEYDFRDKHGLSAKPIIAVLPGSRKQEIESTLHIMMSVINVFSDYQFVVAGVDNLPAEYYDQFKRSKDISVVYGETYELLSSSKMAVVTSGTATLETALLNIPQVVCYKMSFLSALIVRMIIKVKYVSLVNLIADKEVVKELLQEDFTAHNLKDEMKRLLEDEKYLSQLLEGYEGLRKIMGTKKAAHETASIIYASTKSI